MRCLILSVFIFFGVNIFSQNNEEILIGIISQDELIQEPYKEWFNQWYEYNLDNELIKEIKRCNLDFKIIIVLGTWCSDSQEQVPKFIKILDEISFEKSNLEMIAVDHNKKVNNLDIDKYHIERVPTFIFIHENEEIGRITETPTNTLEKDLLKILTD